MTHYLALNFKTQRNWLATNFHFTKIRKPVIPHALKGKKFVIFYVITLLDEIGESELTLCTNSLQPHSKTGYASGIPRIIHFR